MTDDAQSGPYSGTDNRRANLRVKVSVPVEIATQDDAPAIRGATSDLSLGGCYIETRFPFRVGTSLGLKLQIGDGTLLVDALVVTSDPQVGNGIEFLKMLPEDREELLAFIEAAAEAQNPKT
jgi:c-di-GMP-binding flagellar brake protein YcgR